jgi:catechol 2,3-dioxygenase-like lactoylglutathione lyase family enzyme
MPIVFGEAVPFLACSDVESAISFYVEKLGFVKDWVWGDPITDGGVRRDEMRLYFFKYDDLAARVHGSEVMLPVSPIEEVYQEHIARGAPITSAIKDEPWGVREYSVTGPHDYILRFCEGLNEIKQREA